MRFSVTFSGGIKGEAEENASFPPSDAQGGFRLLAPAVVGPVPRLPLTPVGSVLA